MLFMAAVALAGCGEGHGGTAENPTQGISKAAGHGAPKPGSNVPAGGKTIIARVYETRQEGIPADSGQWMVTIGVAPGNQLAYTVGKVIAPPGNTNFRLVNPQPTGHSLQIERVGATKGKEWVFYPPSKAEPNLTYYEELGSEEIEGGNVKTSVVKKGSSWLRKPLLEGKRYVFYCSIPGHREAGMEGMIVVDPKLNAEDLKPF
ncbi:MAG TPA: plastocyanin/azurin family copper-binding protein [Solirubrobacterales bacterium]|nr:plastocyanin/azurin family copper-binding protein [Solirubrobacterales bacterium]